MGRESDGLEIVVTVGIRLQLAGDPALAVVIALVAVVDW